MSFKAISRWTLFLWRKNKKQYKQEKSIKKTVSNGSVEKSDRLEKSNEYFLSLYFLLILFISGHDSLNWTI